MIRSKISGDTIIATLARQTGQAIEGHHGVMYAPNESGVFIKPFGTVRLPNGTIVPATWFYKVAPWQDDHARKLLNALNYQLHHDGAWSVLWSLPTKDGVPTQISMAFQDKDGDILFVITSDRTLADLQMNGPLSQMEVCEKAYKQQTGWLKDVEIRPDQTIKFGQGQMQRDPNDNPLL